MNKRKITAIVISVAVILALLAGLLIAGLSQTKAQEITVQEAQTIVNGQFDAMAGTKALIGRRNSISLKRISDAVELITMQLQYLLTAP